MSGIQLSRETKKELTAKIQLFFAQERDEEISSFQAGLLLDFVLEHIGPSIYNQAVADAHALMAGKIEDLFGLEKRPR